MLLSSLLLSLNMVNLSKFSSFQMKPSIKQTKLFSRLSPFLLSKVFHKCWQWCKPWSDCLIWVNSVCSCIFLPKLLKLEICELFSDRIFFIQENEKSKLDFCELFSGRMIFKNNKTPTLCSSPFSGENNILSTTCASFGAPSPSTCSCRARAAGWRDARCFACGVFINIRSSSPLKYLFLHENTGIVQTRAVDERVFDDN